MAKSLFSVASSAGRLQGQYKASMYDVASFDTQKKFANLIAEEKQSQFDEAIGSVSSALNIASMAYGSYQDTAQDIKMIEQSEGELQTGNRFLKTAGLALGVGKGTFGDSTIAAGDISTQANMLKYLGGGSVPSMFEDATKSISSGTVTYGQALKDRENYQDLLNKFHSGTDMSVSAFEALQL
tara:strand:+ start:358 stop:906 length:549 start_codon:yes stop_codon:yes gene_type:complete